MKGIDNDIEQFEKNLIEIDSMKTQIIELKTSLDKIVKDTGDIEKIKKGIDNEIQNMKKTNGTAINLVDEKNKELKEITIEVKKSLEKHADKIVEPIEFSLVGISNKINQLDEKISGFASQIKEKQELLEKKIRATSIISIIGFVIILVTLLIK